MFDEFFIKVEDLHNRIEQYNLNPENYYEGYEIELIKERRNLLIEYDRLFVYECDNIISIANWRRE